MLWASRRRGPSSSLYSSHSAPFRSVLWALAFVLQGFAVQLLGLVSHDLFVHRRVGGATVAWLGSLLCTVPRLTKPSAYEMVHLEHHRYAGTDRDTEAYKRDIDTRARRLLFLTVPGIKILQGRKLARTNPEIAEKPVAYHDQAAARPELARKLAVEKWLTRAFLLAVVAAAFVWPRLVLLGYLVPVVVMAPIANTVRMILEHSDADPDNPFHVATFYRTGLISRPLFLWDSGDCHLIHHLYATIPYYRVGKALTLMRPILLKHGVVERRSFLALLHGWFVANYAHGTPWPVVP